MKILLRDDHDIFVSYSYSIPKNDIALAVVTSPTVNAGTPTVSASFLATSAQSAGSLDRLPFLNPMKGASVSTMSFSNGNDGNNSRNGAPRSFLQIVPVNPI
mmetsp:Transcript_7986/g.10335  ORF Transcript_7986/g.10335 Transcript_7986/m.10335 type:complete len:102 (-) Transcript_7986:435-740(-)